MSYLTKMTDEELQYICDVIPYDYRLLGKQAVAVG